MNRATRSGVALVSAVLLGGALTACETLFDLPDGYLVDGGDGAPDEEGGAKSDAEAGATDADTFTQHDGAAGSEAGADATTGDASPSDSSTPPDGTVLPDAAGAEAGPEAGPEAGAEAGPEAGPGGGCTTAALSFYSQDYFDHLYTADFAGKKLDEVTTSDCLGQGDAQHLTVTRAGVGWLLDKDGVIHDLDLGKGTCSEQGTVTGGASYDKMALAFVRPGTLPTDELYTCSPAGLGTINLGSYAWSLISSIAFVDHSLGCTIKPGRNGSLAILASSGNNQSAQYTLYEVDASGTMITKKAFGTAIYDDGNSNEDSFDLAWSSASALYYVYGPLADGDNGVIVWTYDPSSGAINELFEDDGNNFLTAGQSTCAQ